MCEDLIRRHMETRSESSSLQETKIQAFTDRILLSMLGTELDRYVALPAQGTRGGILIAWKGNVCREITSRVDSHSVSVLFNSSNG